MRGRTKLVSVVSMLAILLAASVVFGTGVIDVSKTQFVGLLYPTAGPTATTKVLVDPTKVIKDWLVEPTYRPGNSFTIRVNISSVTDLYTWQVNLTTRRNPYSGALILNVTRAISDEFLARSPNQTSSEVLGLVVNSTDNANNCAGFSETILGNIGGITGTGRLVSIQFLIVGYGGTNITISKTGNLRTTLLDHNGVEIPFDPVNGYFSNKLLGDVNGDRKVDWSDLFDLSKAYGSIPSQAKWNIECDFNRDDKVDWSDLFDLSKNYGKIV